MNHALALIFAAAECALDLKVESLSERRGKLVALHLKTGYCEGMRRPCTYKLGLTLLDVECSGGGWAVQAEGVANLDVPSADRSPQSDIALLAYLQRLAHAGRPVNPAPARGAVALSKHQLPKEDFHGTDPGSSGAAPATNGAGGGSGSTGRLGDTVDFVVTVAAATRYGLPGLDAHL